MNKAKILVVDDHPANLLALEVLLEDFDIELLQASSGAEALRLLNTENNVAMVLLDVQMPNMDGYQVAEHMQTQTHTQLIPIIFVTAINDDIQNITRGYASGAVDFLSKPINGNALQSKVRIFLNLDQKSRELAAANQLLQQSLSEVERLQKHNALLLQSIGQGILSLDRHGSIISANPAAHTLLGATDSLIGCTLGARLAANPTAELGIKKLLDQCLSGNTWEETLLAKRKDTHFPAQMIATPLKNDKGLITGVSVALQDATEYQKRESALRAESERDPLTGLINRRGLERHIQQRLPYGANCTALIYIDLNKFKPINDNLGHKMGDIVLKNVATRFENITRSGDLVTRIGGDEFCIVLSSDEPEKAAKAVAEKLLNALAEPVIAEGYTLEISVSIGIAIGREGDAVEELIEAADMAMLQCKRDGDLNYRFA